MVKILICGDYCPQDIVHDLIEKEDYKSVFGEIRPYTSMADYSIVNLEAPVVNSKATAIEKCGPNLKCSNRAIKALKNAGFDLVTLANNHFYDYGYSGVVDTLASCKENNIDVVGGGINLKEASRTFYKNIKGVKFALINCCEHEFSIATDKTGGSNPLNPIQQFYAIQEAKKLADKIIVIVHGGHEHYQLPSPRMKETYRFFVEIGADAVINHHQHCYSGYEVYNGKPIFYGLGNFSFNRNNKKNSIWNYGFMVQLSFDDDKIQHELIPYCQGNVKPGVEVLKNKEDFLISISELNKVIADDKQLKEKHVSFMNDTTSGYLVEFQPYQNHYLRALYIRHLLPSLLFKKRILRLLNILECEAHLERTINSLHNLLRNK